MASAARRPEGFLRSNRREGAQTGHAPSGLEVRFGEITKCPQVNGPESLPICDVNGLAFRSKGRGARSK